MQAPFLFLLSLFYYWLKVISAVTTPDLILSQFYIHSNRYYQW